MTIFDLASDVIAGSTAFAGFTVRMVAALRKAHAMPPKEQKDMKRGKSYAKRKKTAKLNE